MIIITTRILIRMKLIIMSLDHVLNRFGPRQEAMTAECFDLTGIEIKTFDQNVNNLSECVQNVSQIVVECGMWTSPSQNPEYLSAQRSGTHCCHGRRCGPTERCTNILFGGLL